MYTIYVLLLDNNHLYIGMTKNLKNRIEGHKNNTTYTTRNRKIIRVGIIERCDNRQIARKREIYWKSGAGREKLKLWAFSSVG